MLRQRLRLLLPALWAGLLLCIALLATPAAFAVLPAADAGRVVARVFAQEAPLSLGLGLVMLMLERQAAQQAAERGQGSVFSADMMLALGTLFCTVAGYYALQPMMAAARAGQGSRSFGELHAVSLGLFVLKGLLVMALAWRRSRAVAAA
jgi:hypothetical protein